MASVIFLLSLYYDNKYRQIRSQYNLKRPKPLPIIGNSFSLLSKPKQELFQSWFQRYGKIYVHFVGKNPIIVIADREIVRQVCYEDCDCMSNCYFPKGLNPETILDSLFLTKGISRKRARTLSLSTSTGLKMKRMYNLLDICADELVDCISEQIDTYCCDKQEILLKTNSINNFILDSKTYKLYGLSCLATFCLALQMYKYENDLSLNERVIRKEFKYYPNKMLQLRGIPKTISKSLMPKLLMDRFVGKRFNSKNTRILNDMMRKVIKKKDLEGRNGGDDRYRLDVILGEDDGDMIELTCEEDDFENDSCKSILEGHKEVKKQLRSSLSSISNSRIQLISEAISLLTIGFEKTSSLLTLITYCLAHHQQIQQKLYETISLISIKFNKKTFNHNKLRYKFDCDKLLECEYLEAVILETLRVLPPVFSVDELINYDCKIEKYNTSLLKGSRIKFDVNTIHKDPENWLKPDEFDPERFMPENQHNILPGSFIPFGLKSRHCNGLGFIIDETKLGIAKVLMEYKFTSVTGSLFPPKEKSSLVKHNKYRKINVIASRRSIV